MINNIDIDINIPLRSTFSVASVIFRCLVRGGRPEGARSGGPGGGVSSPREQNAPQLGCVPEVRREGLTIVVSERSASVPFLDVGRNHRAAAAFLHRSRRFRAPQSVQLQSQLGTRATGRTADLVRVDRLTVWNAPKVIRADRIPLIRRGPQVLEHREQVLADRRRLSHYVDASCEGTLFVQSSLRLSLWSDALWAILKEIMECRQGNSLENESFERKRLEKHRDRCFGYCRAFY